LLASGAWYWFVVPADIRSVLFGDSAQVRGYFSPVLWILPVVVTGLMVATFKANVTLQRVVAVVVAVGAFWWIGDFEYSREIARKPYVVYNHIYSNSIFVDEVEELNKTGVLKASKWSRVKEITKDNQVEAGYEVFKAQCLSCHTLTGRYAFPERVANFSYMGMLSQLHGQSKVLRYMPPFVGTKQEKQALAAWVTKELNEGEIVDHPDKADLELEEVEIPAKTNDEYVLLAWNDLGMHCISDSDPWFVFLPPANTLEAQLIKRGDPPELVTDNVTLSYKADPDYDEPWKHSRFWDYEDKTFGVELEKGMGLGGKGMNGTFDKVEGAPAFKAPMIPIVPWHDETGKHNPYPLFEVEARDAEGNLLAATKVVTPVGTEMGCRNCHGGGWRFPGETGMADETARNILAAHDRIEGTDLLAQAEAGNPQLCQSCHGDPALGVPSNDQHLDMSTAMHGWHANYMHEKGGDACVMCHPGYEKGHTRCLRSIHAEMGITCVECHGEMSDHALSLLKNEQDKPSAKRMMAKLEPVAVDNIDEINPRQSWLNEPDCLNCHVSFGPPETFDAFNTWTSGGEELYRNRTDMTGSVRCAACHGSPHALYPADNPRYRDADNIQPTQYMGEPLPIGSNKNCKVCHTVQYDMSMHHENMYRMFRNR
jgi:mono/diheme cytochrome c family protein